MLNWKFLFCELVETGLKEIVANLSDDKSDCVIKFLNLAKVSKFPTYKKMVP